jgi:hypothetical protein
VLAGDDSNVQVRTRANNPDRLLARLVPFALLLRFETDILIGITEAATGTTGVGILAFMAMHTAVAGAAASSHLRFLPVHPVDG